jgi:hypothetical protein
MATFAEPRVATVSGRGLAFAALGACAVAAVVLVGAVLPAEYGRDPIGTGKALGLLDLYERKADEAEPQRPVADGAQPRTYKVRIRAATRPGPGVRVQVSPRAGRLDGLRWSTDVPIKFEFHGEPDDRSLDVITCEKHEGARASGALTARFTGIHGWYWENPRNER